MFTTRSPLIPDPDQKVPGVMAQLRHPGIMVPATGIITIITEVVKMQADFSGMHLEVPAVPVANQPPVHRQVLPAPAARAVRMHQPENSD